VTIKIVHCQKNLKWLDFFLENSPVLNFMKIHLAILHLYVYWQTDEQSSCSRHSVNVRMTVCAQTHIPTTFLFCCWRSNQGIIVH